jgi:hypothetical protein
MSESLKPEKINYTFVDSLRFIAIITIVIEHSYLYPTATYFDTLGEQWIQTLTMQLFKFGTIIFYILAGFLIGDKIRTTTSLDYLKRRFHSTFKPWLFWLLVFLLLIYVNFFVIYFKQGHVDAFDRPVFTFFDKIRFIITETSFWFILNFLGSISILLIFRRYLYNYKLGIFLLGCSLFYSVNLYFGWIISTHTTAIAGFVFYLWLGVQLHKYFDIFQRWIKKQKTIILVLLTTVTFIFACYESIYLLNLGIKADPYNTLKFTNILYSLAVFLLLYKIGNLKWIEKLNPRSTTFGIHLVHFIIIAQIFPMIFNPLNIKADGRSSLELVGIQYIRFIIAYLSSYLIVYIINKFDRIKWIVGQ